MKKEKATVKNQTNHPNIPKNEYPRPQMKRENWLNLNGEWEFEFDFSKTGKERGVLQKEHLERKIIVPFCPESKLSGIHYKDFINAAWYRRSFTMPSDFKNKTIKLNFEAVDYYTEVWVNGIHAGYHKGGYTPFSLDITGQIQDGENTIVVYVEDDVRSGLQPAGKQSSQYHSCGCAYTRVTGIWQTVWLEAVPKVHISRYEMVPDTDNKKLDIEIQFAGNLCDKKILLLAQYEGENVGHTEIVCSGNQVRTSIALSELHLWEVGKGRLYDLLITVNSEWGQDAVKSYFGMRKFQLTDKGIDINGKPVFQRLVLDQGYYEDGIYTAPTDDALKQDIELSMELGFNGARLHEKVFERRFLYYADQMGYLVWGEYGNWGINRSRSKCLEIFLPEWIEAVQRDFNSPALIGWCPMNEVWDFDGFPPNKEVVRGIYLATKAMDPTRAVIDASGGFHVQTDIYDVHVYEQDVEEFRKIFAPLANGGEAYNTFPERQSYGGEPYFISEYGGIRWNPNQEGWGYGVDPKDIQEFVDRYVGLTTTLLTNSGIFALCYTQLYDVEQEVNGIYYYNRKPKFDKKVMAKLKEAMTQTAEIEK